MQPELANPRIPSATPFTHASRAPHPSSRATNHCPETCNPYPTPKPSSLMPGQLFTQYFLTDGIRATPERRAQAPAFAAFHKEARRLFQDFANYHNPNETQTEQDLIRPLLELLGWTDDLPQQTSRGGEDIPDLLLFADPQAKTRAGSQASPYLEALAVAELKRFRRPLDARGQGKGSRPPHPTPRSFATSPPPKPSPTANSAGASSPTARSGVSTTRRPAPAPPPTTKPTSRPC